MISKVLKLQNSVQTVQPSIFFNFLLVIKIILFSYTNRPRLEFTVFLKVAKKAEPQKSLFSASQIPCKIYPLREIKSGNPVTFPGAKITEQ